MKPKYLDAGQVWEIEHPQVVFRGVLIPIRRTMNSCHDLFTGTCSIRDGGLSSYVPNLPLYWDFCGYSLSQVDAEVLLLRGENARCVFDPWIPVKEPSDV